MAEPERAVALPPGAERLAAWTVRVLVVAWILGGLLAHPHLTAEAKVRIAYALLPLLPLMCALAIALAARGMGAAGWLPLVGGWVFVAGGAAFDIVATLVHTPDLAREANPAARALLDSDHGVGFVYVFAGIAQASVVGFIGALWTGLLRHRRSWLDSAMDLGPRTYGAFVRFALSGKPMTWPQFLWPFGRDRRKMYGCVIWVLVPPLMGLFAHRWCLGLEWFALAPYGTDRYAGVAGIGVGVVAFFVWLYTEWRRRATAASSRN